MNRFILKGVYLLIKVAVGVLVGLLAWLALTYLNTTQVISGVVGLVAAYFTPVVVRFKHDDDEVEFTTMEESDE